MMNTNFNSIEKSLNVETSIVKPDVKQELPNVVLKKDDVEKDYKYTRGQLYSLIEKVKRQLMELWNLRVKVQVQEHMKLQVN